MISLEWVKDYIDISDEDLKQLAVKITEAGINVEKVISNHIDHLVIGEVLECVEHPDSDHLHVTKVNVGNEIKQIVCGAPNVRVGLKVIVALPGAVLPGDFEIKNGKIRGVESDGMLCALYELGLEEKNDETYSKGIHELNSDAPVGKDAMDYLGYTDTLYELDIHKHRNNDCYYHIGFAYEIGAILGKKVTLPDAQYNEIDEDINDNFNLKIETEKCPYYLAKMVKNVEIKESPEFIKNRLARAGMRSINNVVDISNYVMLEYGQPMHFFDYNKLGKNILVRDAKENEEIITLDGKLRKLTESDIVITDGEKPVCLAGVMGGENTEVDENTNTILIESAIFNPVSIRTTAARLDLRSEASIRYGKGLNYEYTEYAINRACSLLEKYANAKILTGMIKYDNIEKEDKIVKFTTSNINSLLGITLTKEDVINQLIKLDFEYKLDDEVFTVNIPKRRLDIDANINDIAEEVGRLYGYNNLVSTLPKVETKRGDYIGDVKLKKQLSKRLRSLGLNEAKTYTLTSPEMSKLFKYEEKENIILPNPMSQDKSVIRTSILPSLLNVYDYNKARKVEDINIYEIAKTYDINRNEDIKVAMLLSGNYITSDWANSMKVDFYIVKGIVENILDYLGFRNRYTFEKAEINDLHPGVCAKIMLDREMIGVIGKVHPTLKKDDIYVCELSMTKLYEKQIKAIKFKELPKYPSITKDMAFILDKSILASDVMETIKRKGGRSLVDITVFDVYEGINIGLDKKSLAFNLTFNDPNKTLTQEEVMEVFNHIIDEVTNKYNAVLRDK